MQASLTLRITSTFYAFAEFPATTCPHPSASYSKHQILDRRKVLNLPPLSSSLDPRRQPHFCALKTKQGHFFQRVRLPQFKKMAHHSGSQKLSRARSHSPCAVERPRPNMCWRQFQTTPGLPASTAASADTAASQSSTQAPPGRSTSASAEDAASEKGGHATSFEHLEGLQGKERSHIFKDDLPERIGMLQKHFLPPRKVFHQTIFIWPPTVTPPFSSYKKPFS